MISAAPAAENSEKRGSKPRFFAKSRYRRVKGGGKGQINGMGSTVSVRGGRANAAVFLFFLFSFLGWVLEKLWFLFAYGANADRGFLTLPFCTVYGSALLLIRAVLGAPYRPTLGYPKNMLFFLGYALSAALIASAAELVTGLLFEAAFGRRLWLYTGCGTTLWGYVCLPASVGWGFLIPVALQAFWFPLERRLALRDGTVLRAVNGALGCAVLLDFFLTAFA